MTNKTIRKKYSGYDPPTKDVILESYLKYRYYQRYYKSNKYWDDYLFNKNYRLHAKLAGIESVWLVELIDDCNNEYISRVWDYSI